MKKIVSLLVLISATYILTMNNYQQSLFNGLTGAQNWRYHPSQVPFIEKLYRGEKIDIEAYVQVLRTTGCGGSEAMIQQEINYLRALNNNLK